MLGLLATLSLHRAVNRLAAAAARGDRDDVFAGIIELRNEIDGLSEIRPRAGWPAASDVERSTPEQRTQQQTGTFGTLTLHSIK